MLSVILIDFNNLFNFEFTNYFINEAKYNYIENVNTFTFNSQPTKKEFNSEWLLFYKKKPTPLNYFGYDATGFELINTLTSSNQYYYYFLAYLPFFILIIWFFVFVALGFISLERSRIVVLVFLPFLIGIILFASFYLHQTLPKIKDLNFMSFGDKIYKRNEYIRNSSYANLILPINKFNKFNAINYIYSSELALQNLCNVKDLSVYNFKKIPNFFYKNLNALQYNNYSKFTKLKINKQLHSLLYEYAACRPEINLFDKFLSKTVFSFDYQLQANPVPNSNIVRNHYFKENPITGAVKYNTVSRILMSSLPNYQIHSNKNIITTLSFCFWPPIVAVLSFIGLTYQTNKKRIAVFNTLKNNTKKKNQKTFNWKFIYREIYKVHGGIGLIEYSGLEKLPKQKKIKHYTDKKINSLYSIFKQFNTALYTRASSTIVWISLLFWIVLNPVNKPLMSVLGWFTLFIIILLKNNFSFLLINYKKLYIYLVYNNIQNYYKKYNKFLKVNSNSNSKEFKKYILSVVVSVNIFFLSSLEVKIYYLFVLGYLTLSLIIFRCNWNYLFILEPSNVIAGVFIIVFTLILIFLLFYFFLKNNRIYIDICKTSAIIAVLIILSFFGLIASNQNLNTFILDTRSVNITALLLFVVAGCIYQIIWISFTKIIFLENLNKFISLFFFKILCNISKLLIYLSIYLSIFSLFFDKVNFLIFFIFYFTIHCINVVIVNIHLSANPNPNKSIILFAETIFAIILVLLPAFNLVINQQYFLWKTQDYLILSSFFITLLSSFCILSVSLSYKQWKHYKPVFLFVLFGITSWYLLININSFTLCTPGLVYLYNIQVEGNLCLIVWVWSVLRFWRIIKYTKQIEITTSLILILIPSAINLAYNWNDYFIVLDKSNFFVMFFLYELACILFYMFKFRKTITTIQSIRVIVFLFTIIINIFLVILLFSNSFKYDYLFTSCIILNCAQYCVMLLCVIPTTNSARSGKLQDLHGILEGFRFIRKLFGCYFIIISILIIFILINVV